MNQELRIDYKLSISYKPQRQSVELIEYFSFVYVYIQRTQIFNSS